MLVTVIMFLVLLISGLFSLDGASANYRGDNFCKEQKIQEHIDMTQITGMWFVVETITHYENTTIPSPYHEEPSIHFTDVCAVVIISDRQSRLSPIYKNVQVQNQSYSPGYTSYQREDSYTTEFSSSRMNYRERPRDRSNKPYFQEHYPHRKYITVTWDELHTTTTYDAYYTSSPGLWYMYPPVTGDGSPGPPNIVGNIQVLKAVGNHIVLTFCIRWPEEKLFTAILSRSHTLHRRDISGVHNLLRRLQLDFIKSKRMCLLNKSARLNVHYVLFIVLSLMFRLL